MNNFEREEERIRNLFDSVSNESDGDNEVRDSSGDEEDHVSASEHETDSDQEAESEPEDIDTFEEDEMPLSRRLDVFYGKNGTQWKKNPPTQNVRTRSVNIISHLPGVKQAAKNAKTPIDAFSLFFDDLILDDITTCTNIYIQSISHNFAQIRDANLTDRDEVRALLGLLYFAGVMRSNHLNTKDLWNNDGSGIEIFPATMGMNRFHFLLRCLRFDNINTRQERRSVDKLAPLRHIFEAVVSNFQKALTPSEYMTIDEKLQPYRGKCPFRQYIKNKPAKYGIKIFGLADSRLFYTYNLEVYCGKQPDGPFRVSNAGSDVVKRLVAPISGSKRNIFCDNWFMSVPLALDLLKDYGLTITGTLRKNKRELPVEFIKKRREQNSTLFGFSKEMTIVSYASKPNSVVILGSTMHHDNKLDDSTGAQRKPEIITDYNRNKGGIDVVDKLCGEYTVSRKCKRWPLTVFFGLMDIAAINALIIYRQNMFNETPILRRDFLKQLALGLTKPHLVTRCAIQGLPIHIKEKVRRISGNQEEPQRKRQRRESGRCDDCPRGKDRKTKTSCSNCNKLLCKEHSHVYCGECAAE